jgi:hypothetical protein
MTMNKTLVLLLVTCLLASLILPAVEAASYRRNRGRGRMSARSRSRLSNARRSQARALRQARQRQAARRAGRQEVSEANPPPDAIVVEDDSMASLPGMGEICEAVIFTKNEEVIDFKFIKNNC